MRLLIIGLCCGCSLVNSTTDLRNADGGSVDALVGDAGAETSPPDDAGPADAGDDAGCVTPAVEAIEVTYAGYPPTFEVTFVDDFSCSKTVMVQEPVSTTDLMINVVNGMRVATFDYEGPRVPLFDPADLGRERTFRFDGVDAPSVTMPVEQMQVFTRASEDAPLVFQKDFVTYLLPPSIDVANNGTVVFNSNESMLGAVSSDIFLWFVGNNELDRPGRSPKSGEAGAVISDDGLVIAYVADGTRAFFSDFAVSGDTPISLTTANPLAASGHLDLRQTAEPGKYRLAVHTNDSGTDGVEVFDISGGSVTLVELFSRDGVTFFFEEDSGPPLLYRHGDDINFAATYLGGTRPFARIVGRGLAFDKESCDTTPSTLVSGGQGNTRDFVCDDNTLILGSAEIVLASLSTFGLIDSTDDHSLALLQQGPPYQGPDSFVLVRQDGQQRSLALDGQGVLAGDAMVVGGFAGAALSPNGEWAAYAIVREEAPNELRIYRIPTRNPTRNPDASP